VTKVGFRQPKQLNCRRDQVGRIAWCGFRSLVSSVSTRLRAGLANRSRIHSSEACIQTHNFQLPPLSKPNDQPVTERAEYTRNVPNITEVENPDVQNTEVGKDGTTCVGESEGKDEGMKMVEDDGCSGWWWWDTAWNDLTSVTPVDVSTFWYEFNSWLTTAELDNSSQMQTKSEIDRSSCSSSTARHVTSLSGLCDEDEMVKDPTHDGIDESEDREPGSKKNDIDWYHSALKTALLRAASHGHGDVVSDILQQRHVSTVDTDLYDFVNCVDSQV